MCFPPPPSEGVCTPVALSARGYRLRALRDDDSEWLRELYASTRAEEMAPLPWPDAAKRAFLDQQFSLQHRHYLSQYPGSDFLAIEREGHGPVGRYYLQRTAPAHLIIDVSLFPDARQHGVGSLLIASSQQAAAAQGCGIRLHVLQHNYAARRLYARLGFVAVGDLQAAHLQMDWAVPTVS